MVVPSLLFEKSTICEEGGHGVLPIQKVSTGRVDTVRSSFGSKIGIVDRGYRVTVWSSVLLSQRNDTTGTTPCLGYPDRGCLFSYHDNSSSKTNSSSHRARVYYVYRKSWFLCVTSACSASRRLTLCVGGTSPQRRRGAEDAELTQRRPKAIFFSRIQR